MSSRVKLDPGEDHCPYSGGEPDLLREGGLKALTIAEPKLFYEGQRDGVWGGSLGS